MHAYYMRRPVEVETRMWAIERWGRTGVRCINALLYWLQFVRNLVEWATKHVQFGSFNRTLAIARSFQPANRFNQLCVQHGLNENSHNVLCIGIRRRSCVIRLNQNYLSKLIPETVGPKMGHRVCVLCVCIEISTVQIFEGMCACICAGVW